MLELWQSLRDKLRVQLAFEVDESSDKPVAVKFTVNNNAGERPDSYRIVFENVVLKVVVPPEVNSYELGSLAPQETATCEHRCTYTDLVDLEYGVEGTVSPEEFFRVRRAPAKLSGDLINISPAAYIQIFRDMNIHQWLDSTIREFPVPSPDTTLGEIQSLAASLDSPALEIRAIQERLSRLSAFIRSRDREEIYRHMKIVETYLGNTFQSIGQLRQILNSANPRQISDYVTELTSSLEKEAEGVNQATEKLVVSL